mgnify:CR=1 FL=1
MHLPRSGYRCCESDRHIASIHLHAYIGGYFARPLSCSFSSHLDSRPANKLSFVRLGPFSFTWLILLKASVPQVNRSGVEQYKAGQEGKIEGEWVIEDTRLP